jgi:hypothetical protein
LIVLAGCTSDTPTTETPQKCDEFESDVCGLFSCMVDLCWCHDLPPSGGILMEGVREIITEEDAEEEVRRYLTGFYNHEDGVLFGKMRWVEVKNVVELNDVFFNVFAEVDGNGEEEVYTISRDGTIIKTICGV